jgi:hypothetical protein
MATGRPRRFDCSRTAATRRGFESRHRFLVAVQKQESCNGSGVQTIFDKIDPLFVEFLSYAFISRERAVCVRI